jgi:hypothetical protein
MLKKIQAELIQYTFFYGKVAISDIIQLRLQLESIKRVEGDERFQLYFSEMGEIKTKFNNAGYNA